MPGSRLLCAALLVAVVLTAAFAGPASAAPEPFIVVFDEAAVAAAPAAQASGSVVAAGDDDDDDDDERGRKVDGRRVNRKVADLETRHKFKASNVYGALGGFAARLTAKQLRALAADATVDAVVPDVQTSLADPEGADGGIAATGISLASPRTPAGIRRVGATSSPTARINGGDQRVNVDVAILDTGIQGSHPDLNVVGGYNCTSSNRGAWGDGNGHGTHVAGTVAALDNGIGVVGVAPGARLWSVKVLNDKGTGYASWLVCGIDWVTAQKDATSAHGQRMEVVNMSLRFSLPGSDDRDCGIPSNDTVHRAICRSVAAGVTYAVAAGNESRNARVYRPAAYEEVITVSAIADYDGKPGGLARQADYCGFFSADADDSFADFSNYGADIDITAPGKCVLSTYPGSKYAYMSGTSMATPHVAGAAALYRAQFPGARPQQVKMALQHAGRLDWRTSTDPDGRPERNLWVPSYSPPPDYGVSVSTPPAGYLSTTRSVSLTVRINRTNGHNAPVSVSLRNAPTGMKVSGGPFKGAGGTVTITVAPGTAGGTHTVRVRASDGELTRGRAVNLTVDADPPAGYFSRPATGAHVVQSGTSYKIAWQEADAGSGLASRSLQRQRAVPPAAGTCAGAAWKNDGAARTAKADYTETLTTGACHRWVLTLRDNAGNSARVESGTVLVSGSGSTPPPPASAPAVTRPTVAIASSVAMTRADGARVDVTWSASVTGSNVVAHELRLSRDGGSTWSAFALPDPAQPRARLTLTAGTYVVAARAQAATGSWSSWVSSAAFRVTVVPSSDAAFTGSWQSQSVAGASGGLTRYSTQAGASAKFTFTGSSVAVVGATGPDRGQAQIFVDGAQVAVVDLRASTTSWKRVVFSRTWSRAGAHTLEVKVVGTSGRPRVDVDAYVVVGAP